MRTAVLERTRRFFGLTDGPTSGIHAQRRPKASRGAESRMDFPKVLAKRLDGSNVDVVVDSNRLAVMPAVRSDVVR